MTDERTQSEHRLPHDQQAAALARIRVTDTLSGELPPPAVDDALLGVSELVTNAVRHAPSVADAGVILRIGVAGGRATLIVEDGGRDFTPDWRDEEQGAAEGGMGLRIVDRVSTSWGISDDGHNAVWAEVGR